MRLADPGPLPLSIIASLVLAVFFLATRIFVMQRMQAQRQRENRQETERLKSLVAAYRSLAGPVSPATGEHRSQIEEALGDIVLFGSIRQVELAARVNRWAPGSWPEKLHVHSQYYSRGHSMNISPGVTMGLNATPPCFAHRRMAAVIAVMVLVWPALASADCVDTRKPTAGEVEFHSRAIAALVAALPPVPVGGTLQNKDSVTTLGQQCKGATGDFSLEAIRYYELNYRKAIVSVAINVARLPAADNNLSAAYGSASPNRSAGLKVNNVVWRISGSDSPLRQALADAMDRTRLQAMVGKPLPSVAESQALAAQAVPATVAATPAAASAAQAPNVPATQAATQPAAPPKAAAPTSPVQPPAPEPVKEAVDSVNKLRGLFGR